MLAMKTVNQNHHEESAPVVCPVCGSHGLGAAYASDLLLCCDCGHEVKNSSSSLAAAENEVLAVESVNKTDLLLRAKLAISRCYRQSTEGLLDIGSSSGKFLFHAEGEYKRIVGLEVSPRSIDFSRNKLGLEVVSNLVSAPLESISLVTCWHSLEHIPAPEIKDLLNAIRARCSSELRVIVAVPNAQSLQWRMFKTSWTYYDSESHVCQFSPASLTRLFGDAGFVVEKQSSIAVYELFGYLQSFVNIFIAPHNYLYYRMKRGVASSEWQRVVLSYLLCVLFAPLSILLTLYSKINTKHAGVAVCIFKPSKVSPD